MLLPLFANVINSRIMSSQTNLNWQSNLLFLKKMRTVSYVGENLSSITRLESPKDVFIILSGGC